MVNLQSTITISSIPRHSVILSGFFDALEWQDSVILWFWIQPQITEFMMSCFESRVAAAFLDQITWPCIPSKAKNLEIPPEYFQDFTDFTPNAMQKTSPEYQT